MYSAEIQIQDSKIYECLVSESMVYDRSSLEIKDFKEYTLIIIKANDAVAFRASINAVTQLLTVFEKTKNLE